MFLNIFSKYIKSGGSGFFSLHCKTNMKTCFIINTRVPCFKTNLTGFSNCTALQRGCLFQSMGGQSCSLSSHEARGLGLSSTVEDGSVVF